MTRARLSPNNPQVIHRFGSPVDDEMHYESTLPPGVIHHDGSPTTTEDLNLNQLLRQRPSAASSKIGANIPDRWPYFLSRLSEDEAWSKVTVGACVKVAQRTSVGAVSAALSSAMLTPPAITGSAFGWLMATARAMQNGGVA